ncbi:MAG: hypothetical protein CMK44_00915 [Porticoccus sp.]|nr:hypothetical protein [Porticoccus sp.]
MSEDKFIDAELGPDIVVDEPDTIADERVSNNLNLDINTEDNNKSDEELINELKRNISRNSHEIADLKINKQLSSGASNTSEDSNVTTPRKINYIYANIFDEKLDNSNDWTDIKRYRFQKCLWKLKYNRIVSSFYLSNLKNKEHKWSWMIIVISTLTSGLTVANNVDESNAPIDNYNTYVNILLTVSSMSTSLIAAWIKKQMFIEKINEIDKYLTELNSLCEDLEIQLSLLNTDRLKYNDFKEKYIPQLTQYLSNNPIIPPLEWKRCIREITLDYPELLNMDDSEDNKLWPWYGDLISDPKNLDKDAPHVRFRTNFYRRFKKTHKDKYLSTCCGKKQMKVVYDCEYDCEKNNP